MLFNQFIWMFPFRWLVIFNCVCFCIFPSSRFLSARKKSFTDKNPKGTTSWDTPHTNGTPKGQKVSACEWGGTESKTCVQEQWNSEIKPFPGWKRRSSAWRRYTPTRTINPPQATGKERVYIFSSNSLQRNSSNPRINLYVPPLLAVVPGRWRQSLRSHVKRMERCSGLVTRGGGGFSFFLTSLSPGRERGHRVWWMG